MKTLVLELPADDGLNAQSAVRFTLLHQTQARSSPFFSDKAGKGLASYLQAKPCAKAPIDQLPLVDELVLVLPAQRISWHRLVLPRVSPSRMQRALAALLEERFLCEPSLLHLALAPSALPGQTTWVAACDKTWLNHALHVLESVGRPASRIVPQAAPLEDGTPARWRVIGQPGGAWLLRCGDDGVQCLPCDALAAEWLRMEAGSTQAEPALTAWAEQLAAAPVAVCSPSQSLSQAAESAWDLAQFDLSLRRRNPWLSELQKRWQMFCSASAWRPLRWGLLACALAPVVGLNAWAWQTHADLNRKQAALGELLTQHFPSLPVVDPVVQMQREVATLQQATNALAADDLEALLAGLLRGAPELLAVSGLGYKAKILTLHGVDLSPEAMADLRQRLDSAGYRTEFNERALRLQVASSLEVTP